jgi:hypothetical protein
MYNNIEEAVRGAFIDLWADVIGIVPELIAALAVFIIGLIVASITGRLMRKLVRFLKVDALAERMRVHETLGKIGIDLTFSDVLGTITKWFFIIVFLSASVEILGWTQIISFLNDVIRYIPMVLIAVIILAVGLIVASVVEGAVVRGLKSAKTPVESPETLGSVAKWAIVAFSVMASLTQLGVAEGLIEILFAGILLTLVISFGLAGKDKARVFLDKVMP